LQAIWIGEQTKESAKTSKSVLLVWRLAACWYRHTIGQR